mmetsp:Transcript_33626/g.51846  ORF Transcript_33626/g.51846 Transcript_33626/m.51846 type:complete len:133 (-) Transcript_33626:64-462(-)
MLLRLCPIIPFTILNYLMGITAIHLRDFCLGCVGILPATVVYVFVGTTLSNVKDASKNPAQGPLVIILFVGGSLLACLAIIYISWVAKKILNEMLDEHSDRSNPAILQKHPINLGLTNDASTSREEDLESAR